MSGWSQAWKTLGSYVFGNVPDVRQFAISEASEKIAKGDRRARTHHDLTLAYQTQSVELTIHIGLGASARVKRHRHAGLFL